VDGTNIRSAYPSWPRYNDRLTGRVADLTAQQLALQPSADRWPLWATIGHTACQRVFWLCDFAGATGAETTPFPNAAYECPGDDDLDTVLSADQLVTALDSSFRIVERCLDGWTPAMLDDEIRAPWPGDDRHHTRGWVIERVFAHDVYHCAEVNEILTMAGLPQIDLWS
jgi:uncharacterized damage-inducible protein DinB